jgi:predicted TIM-barrel fold metal-dependent hydrolase
MAPAGLRIVDAHFHLWNLDDNYYPWLMDETRPSLVEGRAALRRNYLVTDYLRDVGSLPVVAGVHIQAEHDDRDHVRETRWLSNTAAQPESRGFPHAIVANADLASPDAEQVLEQHASFANTRGIRQALHRRLDDRVPYDPLLDPAWIRQFPLLAKYRLSFDMQLFPRQATAAVDLIRRNPDVQFVLTHAAMPFLRDADNVVLWSRSVRAYASYPNVAIKISGFGGFDPDWSARSIDPIVSEVVAAFTPARCMLGSNFPVEGLVKGYQTIWNVFFEYFAPYSKAEQEMLFWRNAARIYRIAA